MATETNDAAQVIEVAQALLKADAALVERFDRAFELARVRELCASGRARIIREDAHLTTTEVSASVGVSRPTICAWETGRHQPTGTSAVTYLRFLDELVQGNEAAQIGGSANDRALDKARVWQLCSTGRALEIRQGSRLSVRDVGASIGVSGMAVSLWERGGRRPLGWRATAYLRMLDQLERIQTEDAPFPNVPPRA